MIAVRDITVRYGEKLVLDRFSLQLPQRGILCLLGPSGWGKTTLALVFAGLLKPDSGTVEGIGPGETAVLFQEDRLLPWRTAGQNVAAVLPRSRAGEAAAWLAAVELAAVAEKKPAALSGGMNRRVALARALAYGGKLLILDEPFKGLDEDLRRRLYPLLRKAAEERPVLLITHEREEAAELGQVVEVGQA